MRSLIFSYYQSPHLKLSIQCVEMCHEVIVPLKKLAYENIMLQFLPQSRKLPYMSKHVIISTKDLQLLKTSSSNMPP